MTFEELVDQAIALLERRGHVTYRALKRQVQLADDVLEDLTAEIIKAQRRIGSLQALFAPPRERAPHRSPLAPPAVATPCPRLLRRPRVASQPRRSAPAPGVERGAA